MVHSCKNNAKVSSLHESCFRLIYSDRKSSFEELLEKDGLVSIHNKNIQVVAGECTKSKMIPGKDRVSWSDLIFDPKAFILLFGLKETLREKYSNTEFFYGPYFPVFSPNTEKTLYLDTFHAVRVN